MLSAFSARPIVELKQRDKSKIESLLAYGDRLFVGLNTGSLRIYRVKESATAEDDADEGTQNEEGSGQEGLVELLREEEKFSRRAIVQLGLIRDANILVSLSDGYVSFHDLQTFELSEKLDASRGATTFTVTSNIFKDAETDIPMIVSRLAVAVKRKVLIWTWQDMELTGSAQEMTLTNLPKSLTWATGTKIVAGMDSGFVMIDIEKQEVSDIKRPPSGEESSENASSRFGAVSATGMGYMGMGSWIPKPLATKLTEDEVLLAKDVNSLFIDTNGQPLEKRQVPWPTAPEAIGYSYPYLLVLLTGQKMGLELRNPQTLSLLQFISLSNAAILHVPQPNISLAHAGKGFLVSSDRCIWRMDALRYEDQIDELVDRGRFDEALSFAGLLEDTLLLDKTARIREIKCRKAQFFFDSRQYRDALDLFSAAEAPPERVVGLYPESVSGPQSQSGSEGQPISPNSPKNSSKHKRVDSDASYRSKKSVENDGRHSRSKSDSTKTLLEGKDLAIAVNELCAFLAQTRVQLQKYINYDGTLKDSISGDGKPVFEHYILQGDSSDNLDWRKELHKVAVVVDTTLFRAYMLARPGLAGSLFRLDNFCDPGVVKEKLYEHGRYNDLVEFLRGKRVHEEALKLLEELGKGKSDDKVPENLRGPQRTVTYLQQLPFEMIDLILRFAEWPIRADPELGMEVFMADTNNAESLPRGRVVGFLRGIDSDLELRYLEHIVNEYNDNTPEFHERLIRLYLAGLTKRRKNKQSSSEAIKAKLEDMLHKSGQYRKIQLLKELPTNEPELFESRAIVHGKLAQHDKALEIYVFEMKDYQKAEEYCNQTYQQEVAESSVPIDPDDSSQSSSVYTILLSLYLAPASPHEPNFDAALELLSRHGSRLPALKTLALLPDPLPIQQLEEYFRRRMRAANSIAREHAIMAALSNVEKVDTDAALLMGDDVPALKHVDGVAGSGRNRRVVVSEDKLCVVCHKRFGRTAIRVWPDGDVTHYGCSNRARQSS